MVLYFSSGTRCYVHGECSSYGTKSKELIQSAARQFGGVGVNCHQPFGSKRLVCPYEPKSPSPYQPVVLGGLGDKSFSGDFECDPSDSIQTQADSLPDASQLLSPDQISQIEQLWPFDQDEAQSPVGGIQIANKDEFLPISENVDNFQFLDSGPNDMFDGSISESQMESDMFPDMTDYQIIGQDFPSDEEWNDTLFPESGLFA